MYALIVEIDNPVVGALEFKRDPTDLLAFMSFAIAEPLGSQHPLTNLARRLKKDFDINLTPLLTFYDNDIEDDVDAINLEAAWQDAAALNICITEIQTVLEKDERSITIERAEIESVQQDKIVEEEILERSIKQRVNQVLNGLNLNKKVKNLNSGEKIILEKSANFLLEKA